jgi:hypothetical protein
MTRLTSLLFTASLLVGCVGNRSIGQDQPCPCAPGWSCDATKNVCVADGTGGGGGSVGGAGGSGGTASCGATCSTPAGTVQAFTSIADIYAAMAGTWQICAGAALWTSVGAPADVIGIEYGPASTAPTANGSTVGGNMYYLVAGPSGPVRGSGFAYQLTYDISPEGQSSFQLNMHAAPSSGFAGSVRYSPCPTELQLLFLEAGDSSVLVHFGSDWPLPTPDASTDSAGPLNDASASSQ